MSNHRVRFTAHPQAGTLARDTVTGRQGEIVAQEIHTSRSTDRVIRRVIHLRPPGGGIEWTADPEHLQPA